jgi:hypothetical protein
MIPKFTPQGELPPGIYQTTFREMSRRLAWTVERKTLVGHLKLTWQELHHCGVNELFINGSFVTTEPFPNDVDAFWLFTKRVDVGKLQTEYSHLLDGRWMKTHRSIDLFVAEDELIRSELLDFFTHNQYGQEKGILLMSSPRRWLNDQK